MNQIPIDAHTTPAQVRNLIRQGIFSTQTSGLCDGYAQANLLILPKEQAYDFLLFTQRNPKSCPVLEVGDVGSRLIKRMADHADVATDLPKSFIVCHQDGQEIVYISQLSPQTLMKRCKFIQKISYI